MQSIHARETPIHGEEMKNAGQALTRGVSCFAKTTKLRRSVSEKPAPLNFSPPRNWVFAVTFDTFSDGSPATDLTQVRLNMLEAAILPLIEQYTNKDVLVRKNCTISTVDYSQDQNLLYRIVMDQKSGCELVE